jgi:hypothetical protein
LNLLISFIYLAIPKDAVVLNTYILLIYCTGIDEFGVEEHVTDGSLL